MENDQSEKVKLSKQEARQGETKGRVRNILVASLALVVLLGVILLLV